MSFTPESIQARVDALLCPEKENYSLYPVEEIHALALAVVSHRRMVKTANFNALLRRFEELSDAEYSKYQVEQYYLKFQEELDRRTFNFQESPVKIHLSESTTKKLLDMSKAERVSHPRVQLEIDRLSRSLEAKIHEECPNSSLSSEDIAQSLILYLLESAEENFDPTKASYITYAITTLRYRAKIVSASARRQNSREVLTTFENDENSGMYHEKLGVDSTTGSGKPSSLTPDLCEAAHSLPENRCRTSRAVASFFEDFTPLEKSLLFLKNQMNKNVNTFNFDATGIIEKAAIRAKSSIF